MTGIVKVADGGRGGVLAYFIGVHLLPRMNGVRDLLNQRDHPNAEVGRHRVHDAETHERLMPSHMHLHKRSEIK